MQHMGNEERVQAEGAPTGETPPRPTGDAPSRPAGRSLSRRSFAALAGAAALGLASGALPLLGGCRSEAGDEVFKGERKVTDDAGRQLVIPTVSQLKKVYFTSALAQIYVMTLAPDLMGATCSKYTDEDKRFLPSELDGLVYLGSSESNELDVEAVMSQGIQLIFSISSIELTEANISEAENIQDLTGIPVVLIDGSFERISEAYAMLGDILGREERAAELAAYCESAYAAVTDAVKDIPDDQRVGLYYAEGPLGLQTEPASSQHAAAFVAGGARVVAQVDLLDATGMADVSLESVIAWDPEVIVAWDEEVRGGADARIRTHADWSVISAVRNGRVYTMPNVPMSWVDRPMACNRYLGIQWVANMLYPDRYNVDMVEVGKEFYQLFFGAEVTDDEMKGFLGNSYPPYRG